MTSAASSNPRQPVSERSALPAPLRLALLALVAAAFFLVPAAQAAAAEFSFEVKGTGTGEGTVWCKANGSPLLEECEPEYEEGTALVLVAEPEVGSTFVGYAGGTGSATGCDGQTACAFTIEANTAIEAVFGLEEFELKVSTGGSGKGAVACQVDGGSFEPCSAAKKYPFGTVVILYAEPEEESEFVEWSGDCSGVELECELTVEGTLNVTAIFKPESPFALTVQTGGTGEGKVECEVEGEPAEECEAGVEYEEGTAITVIAKPKTGSEFVKWNGECDSVVGNKCKVEMDANKTVEATFAPISRTLTIAEAGTGSGEVKCKFNGGSAGTCTSPQPNGTTVELIATAKAGSEFAGFSSGTGSATACSTSPCSFTIEANSAVTATFAPEPEKFELTIVKAGTGSGSVTCNAGACAATYLEGEEVTLAATAASGSTFSGWSGGGCSGTGSCVVTIEADTTVTATFTANPKPEETCATNASLCPPPLEGKAKAAPSATVKSGKASLKLTCSGGPCKGTLQLTAKVKQGTKIKNLTIGRASFSLAEGATTTLKVKLSGPAKQELAKGKTLKAKAGGTGISASTVKLKPPKK